MKRVISIIIFLVFYVGLSGQDSINKIHPIDIKCKQCLSADSNQTTAGMINCEIIAEQDWDKELNKYYKLLLNGLTPDEKEKLKSSQIQWLKYRDTEIAFSGTMYRDMQGTMWLVVHASRMTEITKQRALELKVYYDMKTFSQ